MFSQDIIFFDIEATGLNVATDRIISISLIKKGKKPAIMNWLLNPGIPIPQSSSDVHGIYDVDVKGCPPFQKIAGEILEFINGYPLGGFNIIRFDVPMLFNEFERAGFEWDYKKHHLVDAGNIYKILNPRTLGSAYKFYMGKELEHAHTAEADNIATFEVFEKMYEKGITNGDQELIEDIPRLALLSNYGKEIIDLGGKFVKDKEGDIMFNFGPHYGKKAKTNLSFLNWMLGKDFPSDTKKVAKQLIKEHTPKVEKTSPEDMW